MMRSMRIGGGSVAEVKWIKIVTDIFDDEKILLIESLPAADSIIVIWFKLLCLAGKNNNSGVFMLNDKIAYTEDMLATIFRRDVNTIKLALRTFEEFGMIEIVNGAITIPNWNKHQSLDVYERKKERDKLYQRKRREKQKILAESTKSSDNRLTENDFNNDLSSDVALLDKEEDKEKDIDKDIKKNNKEKKKKETEFDIEINNYTNDEKLKSVIYEFIKYRKTIKANMTTLALTKLLNKLDTLATNDVEKIKILENSIVNGWKGVFPLHDRTQQKNNIQGFNNFEGRSYNYDDLEKQLLGRG